MNHPDNKPTPFDAAELAELAAANCDGRLTPAEFVRLEEILAGSAAARAYYLRYMNLESALPEFGKPLGDAWLPHAHPLLAAPASKPATRTWMPWALAASLAGLLALGVWQIIRTATRLATSPMAGTTSAVDPGVAVLTKAVGVEWETPALPEGAPVPAGRMKFKAGLVRLEFFSGAAVILEGPAEFEPRAIDQAICYQGKLRAIVPPPAVGFTILTPQSRLVDLGTEFGIDVTADGPAEVHVFDGRVDVYPRHNPEAAPTANLTAGNAARIDITGRLMAIPINPTQFVSAPDIDRQADLRAAEQLVHWRQVSTQWKSDPRLLLYYDFERNGKNQRLMSQWKDPLSLNGAIIGCRWVEGRWPGKGALEFKNPGDRVRISLRRREHPDAKDPERRKDFILPALTLAAWVRLDALDQAYHSLLTSDGQRKQAPAWQITRDGRLQFTINPSKAGTAPWTSSTEPVFDSRHLGQWVHLALTIDTRTGRLAHFVNGQRVAQATMPNRQPLIGGSAELGNWGSPPKEATHPQRRFNGRMDEFMIFSEALDEQAVDELCQVSRPGA